MGIWAKYPIKNTNFVHIFSPVSHQNNTITILRTFSKAYYFNIHCYMLRKKTLLKSKNLFYHQIQLHYYLLGINAHKIFYIHVKYLQSVIKNNLNFLFLFSANPNGDGVRRLTSIWIRNLFRYYLNNFGKNCLLKYFQNI